MLAQRPSPPEAPPVVGPRATQAPAWPQHPPATSQPEPADDDRPAGPSRRRFPRWLIQVIGFVASAVIGITMGYLIVYWLFPQSGLLKIW